MNMVYSKVKVDDKNSSGKRVAFIFIFLFYGLLFFALYWYKLDITKAYPKELAIEVILDEKIMRQVPQGVARRNPLQKPIPNPPIVNVPGTSAPESAPVAATNQSTLPKPRPETKPAEVSEQGDVEVTNTKPVINEKSLFTSHTTGDDENNTSTNINQQTLYSGVGHDNQETRTQDTPVGPDHRQLVTHNLIGRSVVGELPLPTGNQNEGTVVVEITVDQNGNVTKANATGKGTTVQDATLWRSAENAAKKAKFNVKKDAPVFQTGTITYVFKLN